MYSLLWHFLNNNEIAENEQEELISKIKLKDNVNRSRGTASYSNDRKSAGSKPNNITIYKYNSDQLE
jgi:hypothetical protein